jgi:hypothetical protein
VSDDGKKVRRVHPLPDVDLEEVQVGFFPLHENLGDLSITQPQVGVEILCFIACESNLSSGRRFILNLHINFLLVVERSVCSIGS